MSVRMSECDLLLFILAIDKGYTDLLDLYGMFHEHDKCPACGCKTGVQYKLVKEIVASFGSMSLKIPRDSELRQIARDITIWSGLRNCPNIALKSEEYARRYGIQVCNVNKIRSRIQTAVDKFTAMKRVFRKGAGK